ncbi:hypothetical protein ACHQM5_010431 [Ranunculus cassubicifolius]
MMINMSGFTTCLDDLLVFIYEFWYALHVLRTNLNDPNNVLQSWDPTLINPCTWYHVTCNSDNSVTRVDLGNAGLSGTLTPSLGQLANLQYLNLYSNNITGVIPTELGKLTILISLDVANNHLSGTIPSSLSNLRSLRFLRLNGNHLSGTIPSQLIQLVLNGNLEELNVSNNNLAGTENIRLEHFELA